MNVGLTWPAQTKTRDSNHAVKRVSTPRQFGGPNSWTGYHTFFAGRRHPVFVEALNEREFPRRHISGRDRFVCASPENSRESGSVHGIGAAAVIAHRCERPCQPPSELQRWPHCLRYIILNGPHQIISLPVGSQLDVEAALKLGNRMDVPAAHLLRHNPVHCHGPAHRCLVQPSAQKLG